MASKAKTAQHLARALFRASLVGGALSEERVGGVIAYIEKARPANPLWVLRAYHRLVANEVAKGVAVVEHAGAVGEATLASIAGAMAKKYSRPVRAVPRDEPSLVAGIRVRIGDDVYESSIAGQLEALSGAA
ncbi:MAG TPA: F0F1 ATP synthase subunit delta [Opitutaceae bacterium]|jgi:F-type H+-transporting ATPase subunit delta